MSVESLSATVADELLALVLNGTSYTGPSGTLYAQLHVGHPGSAGTTSIAGETVRQACGTFTAPAAGVATNNAAITWTSVTTAETYSFITLWSASTGGVFVASGAITASAVGVGDNFSIPIGDASVTFPVAA
jgi:hypothetical protein